MISKDIARRAYAIWEIAGHPQGKALDHWLQAESELAEAKHALSGEHPSLPAPMLLKGKKPSRPAVRSTS